MAPGNREAALEKFERWLVHKRLLGFQESQLSVMASLSDLFEDFSRLKEFSEPQVVELVNSFRQINEKLEEDLPSGLEGYAEFLKDKGLGGSGSKVEKLIKSSISSDCTQIVRSNAYKLACAYLYTKNQSIQPKANESYFNEVRAEAIDLVALTSFDEEALDPLNLLKLVLKIRFGLRRGRSFFLPWNSAIRFEEINPNKAPIISSNFLLGRVRPFLKIKNNEVYESLFEGLKEKDETTKQSKIEPLISFFADNHKLTILESLLMDDFTQGSNTALSLWITSKLSELISSATLTPFTATLEQAGAESLQLDQDTTRKLLNDNERFIVDRLIPQAAHKVEELLPRDNFLAWQELEEECGKLLRNLRKLDRDYGRTINRLLGEEDDLLYSEIFEFLKTNGLNTVSIPTIDELGKHKGGYSLVKKIAQSGGLKTVRKKYIPWAMRKVAENTTSPENTKNSSSIERYLEAQIVQLQDAARAKEIDLKAQLVTLQDAARAKERKNEEYRKNLEKSMEEISSQRMRMEIEIAALKLERDSLRGKTRKPDDAHQDE